MNTADEITIIQDPQTNAISCLTDFAYEEEEEKESLTLLISEDGDIL